MITKSVLQYKRSHRSRLRGSLLNQNTISALVCGKFFSLMCRISAEKCSGRQTFRTPETSFLCFISVHTARIQQGVSRADPCGRVWTTSLLFSCYPDS